MAGNVFLERFAHFKAANMDVDVPDVGNVKPWISGVIGAGAGAITGALDPDIDPVTGEKRRGATMLRRAAVGGLLGAGGSIAANALSRMTSNHAPASSAPAAPVPSSGGGSSAPAGGDPTEQYKKIIDDSTHRGTVNGAIGGGLIGGGLGYGSLAGLNKLRNIPRRMLNQAPLPTSPKLKAIWTALGGVPGAAIGALSGRSSGREAGERQVLNHIQGKE